MGLEAGAHLPGRDGRGGSLPDEVGFSPQDNSRRMIGKDLALATSGSERR